MNLPKPWQACVDAFLQAVYDRSGSYGSLYNYRSVLRRFFSDPARTPDTYTQMDVRMFLDLPSASNRNYGKPVSAAAKNARLEALASFYRFSASYEVGGVPLLSSKPPTYGIRYIKAEVAPRSLSSQELETFFSVIDVTTVKGARDYAIFLTYFLTAKRRSEISNLRVGDIQETTLIGKDGSRNPGHTFKYRAKGRQRTVAISELPSLAYEAIVQYWRVSGRLEHLKSDNPVFISLRPEDQAANETLSGNYINTVFKRYCAKAGLNPAYSLHSLRHTSARLRYELGSDIRSIQEILGHANIGITDLYLRSLTSVSDPGASLLEKRFPHLGKLK